MTTGPKPLLRKQRVLELIQSSKSKLYADIAAGIFPKPLKHGRSSFWLAEEVAAWIERRITERDTKNETQSTATLSIEKPSREICVASKNRSKAVVGGRTPPIAPSENSDRPIAIFHIGPMRTRDLRPKATPITAADTGSASGKQESLGFAKQSPFLPQQEKSVSV